MGTEYYTTKLELMDNFGLLAEFKNLLVKLDKNTYNHFDYENLKNELELCQTEMLWRMGNKND